jgi:methyltransferase-like protein
MFAQTQDKVTQARLILDFIKDSLEGVTGPHADMMRVESAMLANQPDNYLRHDHLSENNTQFYLHEFATRARAHNLQYLSDCNISGMYLGNLAPKVAEKLKSIDDVVKVEQYIDFLTNRRFRYTLLCHNTIKLNRNLNADDIAKFNMVFNLTTEKELADIDINDSVELLKFFHRNNKEIFVSTSSPYMKAILYSFYENHKNPISYDQLLKSANKKLGDNKLAEITSELINNAMQLVLKGFLEITCLEHRKVTCSDDKPKLAKLPFYQVTKTDNLWVTNLMHELIPINSFDKIVFKYMDGKHDKNAIIERTIEDMSSSGLVLREGEVPITNKDDIGKAIETALDITISRARANALFV